MQNLELESKPWIHLNQNLKPNQNLWTHKVQNLEPVMVHVPSHVEIPRKWCYAVCKAITTFDGSAFDALLIKRKRSTNTKTRYLKSIWQRPTQALVEWSWHVISIAAYNITVTSPDLPDHKKKHLNRWAKRRLIMKIARSKLSA